MPRHLHLDFETFSEAELKDVGAYRYAYDPSTEILCAAMSLDGGEPVAWAADDDLGYTDLIPYFDALADPEVLIYAHNANFEIAICRALLQRTWGIPCPALSRFRCTMSLAQRACLPASLEKVSALFPDIPQKDKRGAALIRKFCVMQTPKKPTKANPAGMPARRIHPSDEPEAFAELVEYCRQDVRAEVAIAKKLAYFDEPHGNGVFSLTATINDRGVAVNVPALRHAQRIIDEETAIVSAKFRALTGFEVTQNAVLLGWVNGKGHSFDNLQAETVDTFLEQHEAADDDVVTALRLKQSIAYASIKKVATMLACVGPHDNRIRGMLRHHGATTGRWTASLVQFQNMRRATISNTERAYSDICKGISRDELEIIYGPPLEVLASCIRHFVQDNNFSACTDPVL